MGLLPHGSQVPRDAAWAASLCRDVATALGSWGWESPPWFQTHCSRALQVWWWPAWALLHNGARALFLELPVADSPPSEWGPRGAPSAGAASGCENPAFRPPRLVVSGGPSQDRAAGWGAERPEGSAPSTRRCTWAARAQPTPAKPAVFQVRVSWGFHGCCKLDAQKGNGRPCSCSPGSVSPFCAGTSCPAPSAGLMCQPGARSLQSPPLCVGGSLRGPVPELAPLPPPGTCPQKCWRGRQSVLLCLGRLRPSGQQLPRE